MTVTTRYPFEVPYPEIEVDVDTFIDAISSTLQSSFLLLPRGPGFVAYLDFQQAYEVLKRRKLLEATQGKVFTLKTVDRMIENTALREFKSR